MQFLDYLLIVIEKGGKANGLSEVCADFQSINKISAQN